MDLSIDSLAGLESTISLTIRLVGTAIETFGVFIIVAGHRLVDAAQRLLAPERRRL